MKKTLEEKRAFAKEFILAMAKTAYAESDYYAAYAKERSASGLFYVAHAEATENLDETMLDLMIGQWGARHEAQEANRTKKVTETNMDILMFEWLRPPASAEPATEKP